MIGLYPTTFEEFLSEAKRGNVVPVVRRVLADLQTPVGAFLRVADGARYAFLLESIDGGQRVARYTFLGANPEMVVRGVGDDTVIEKASERKVLRGVRATAFAREYFRDRELARRSGLAPLAGGAVGYLTYEAARWFEPVLEKDNDSRIETDDAVWMFYRTVLAFDRVNQCVDITSIVLTEEAEGSHDKLRQLFKRAVEETSRIEKLLLEAGPQEMPPQRSKRSSGMFKSNWSRANFEEAVRWAQEHIALGDCYQVVLSQRLKKKTHATPINIYRALRATNPAPYMYLFQLGDETLIGASHQRLVRCRGQRLDYHAVAGTRRRGATEAEDWLLGEELRTDEKAVAEHMLMVDVGRNDLGRVSDYGSVEVEDLMAIERCSHVQHLVTSLRARLRDELDRFDALASCFPAGAVAGAPKVRAMQIIREIERVARGIYAGAILYMDYAQNLDSCIAIRTILMREGHAYVQTGVSVVADSVPESEFEETINRAHTLLRAIEIAERGL